MRRIGRCGVGYRALVRPRCVWYHGRSTNFQPRSQYRGVAAGKTMERVSIWPRASYEPCRCLVRLVYVGTNIDERKKRREKRKKKKNGKRIGPVRCRCIGRECREKGGEREVRRGGKRMTSFCGSWKFRPFKYWNEYHWPNIYLTSARLRALLSSPVFRQSSAINPLSVPTLLLPQAENSCPPCTVYSDNICRILATRISPISPRLSPTRFFINTIYLPVGSTFACVSTSWIVMIFLTKCFCFNKNRMWRFFFRKLDFWGIWSFRKFH